MGNLRDDGERPHMGKAGAPDMRRNWQADRTHGELARAHDGAAAGRKPDDEHTVSAHATFAMIIISHGDLAVELKKALEHLMGPQPLVVALSIPADEPLATTRARLRALIGDLRAMMPATDGLVFLSDLFGGTPANLALAEMKRHRPAWLLTGANLPMLVRLVELRGALAPEAAVEEAAAAGRRFIRSEHNPA